MKPYLIEGYEDRALQTMRIFVFLSLLVLGIPQRALSWGSGDLFQVSMAFLTNLFIHETGHFIVAESVNALDNKLNFFFNEEGSFFLGRSTVGRIDERSRLPYVLGGEIATSVSFEIALNRYRSHPTTYNRSLLFFSGTEFLLYSIYAFHLAPFKDDRYDPVAISNLTGLNPRAILAIAMIQTGLDAYRVFSSQDRFFPYFEFDRESVSFLVGIRF